MIEKICEEIARRDSTDGTVKVFSGKEAISIVQEVAKEYGNGWIPVEERLPEEKVDVLICYKEMENGTEETGVAISNYREITFGGRPTGYKNWIAPFSYFNQNYEVIAWQPLPAPYQKGE